MSAESSHNTDQPSRIALVMGGNWEPNRPDDDLTLSIESRVRVRALGILASEGLVDTAIFCAGLTKGPNETPEAEAQHDELRRQFPDISGLEVIEEGLGHTTKRDAIYTKRIIEERGFIGPYHLITSQSFLKRQTKLFRREGIPVIPTAAEPIVARHSLEDAQYINRYLHSRRHYKWLASEAILRGLAVVDPDSFVTEWLAARSRPNHRPA